jgi:pimeloyl-ACP methyl ester carboxylesterase
MTPMTAEDFRHRFVNTNGIRMHIAEAGEGPLVILCHGFPECWYSWRHQLAALASAGYHAVAPDQRGYGQTDRPDGAERYTMLHLAGDIVGLLDALGEETAVIVGHDWGGPVAWNAALMRPDRFRAVAGLSVPYVPRGPMSLLQAFKIAAGEDFYMVYFQKPGQAEAVLERDPHASIRGILYSGSGDALPEYRWNPVGAAFDPASLPQDVPLPPWLTEADVDFYACEFGRTGFTGGLNWYRSIDLTWELTAPFAGAPIQQPSLFIAGKEDGVLRFPGMSGVIAGLQKSLPGLRGTVLFDGCGHWVQQERPAEVNEALIRFVNAL